jgi:hypothetical protein
MWVMLVNYALTTIVVYWKLRVFLGLSLHELCTFLVHWLTVCKNRCIKVFLFGKIMNIGVSFSFFLKENSRRPAFALRRENDKVQR